jgi:hypothetical protein
MMGEMKPCATATGSTRIVEDFSLNTPVVSIGQIAGQFDISYQVASTIVSQLEKAGIHRETAGRKRDKRFVYIDYLNILSEGSKI